MSWRTRTIIVLASAVVFVGMVAYDWATYGDPTMLLVALGAFAIGFLSFSLLSLLKRWRKPHA